MGERLLRYYKHIVGELGPSGRLKLAIATKIPSASAAIEPDSPENIDKFKQVVKEITGKAAPDF